MPLMDNLRRFFRKEQTATSPVEIDLTGTQAESLGNAKSEVGDSGAAHRSAQDTTNGEITNTRRPGKNRSMAELQRGYDEVMTLVSKVSSHLDSQAQRTERMMELLEHLPKAIEALPEINRQSAQMQETLSEHLNQVHRRESALNDTLARLTESSSYQTEVLGLLQQQLDANSRTSEQMTETLGTFREALGNLASTSSRSADVLSKMAEATEERESRLVAVLHGTQRWLIGAVVGCGTLAVLAIVLALLAISSG